VLEDETGQGWFNMGINGTVFKTANPVSPPFTPIDMPEYQSSGDGLVQVSTYLLNSMMFAIHDLLVVHLTDDMLPDDSPLRLTTDDLDQYVPGLATAFGKGKKCIIDCNLPDAPVVHIKDKLFQDKSDGFCSLAVQTDANTQAKALDMKVAISLKANLTVKVNDTGIYGNAKVPEALVETLEFSSMADGINLDQDKSKATANAVLAAIADMLNQDGFWFGVALPDWIKLKGIDLIWKDEVLEAGLISDFDYEALRKIFF
jgi:hypothetical protein